MVVTVTEACQAGGDAGWLGGMGFPGDRPLSLREIAREAGVSRMAVSRAFKPGAEISAALRERVLAVARRRGYRPDPLVGEIMTHFARGRRGVHRETLGVLWWDQASSGAGGYGPEIRRGLEEEAGRYGCGVDHLVAAKERGGLERVLTARGIRSLILTPAFGRVEVSLDLDWEKFSIVAVGNSLREPPLHRVVHGHYAAAARVMRELAARGCRRPALVVGAVAEERIRRAYTAAFLAMQDGRGAGRIFCAARNGDSTTETWLERQRAEAVVLGWDGLLRPAAMRRLAAKGVAVVSLDFQENGGPAGGIRQHPRSMGRWAVDLLMQMRWRGETGIPAEPVTLTVEGTWIAGAGVTSGSASKRPC